MVDVKREIREEDLNGAHMADEGIIKEGSMEEEVVQ